MPERKTERKSIWVYIKLTGDGFANDDEFDLRWELEDQITERNIGQIEGGGSGGGVMDFSFNVANETAVETALIALRQLLKDYHVPDSIVEIQVRDVYEPVCDDLPDFQPGHCLNFHFEDGEYGALIVLKRGNERFKADMTLVGVLDYKETISPDLEIFEQRKWLIGTHESWRGKPYLIWLHCYGGVVFNIIGKVQLKADDPQDCRFTLWWEDVGEYFLKEKYRKLDDA